jgi:hypothetical protein
MTATELKEFEDNLPKHLTPTQYHQATIDYCVYGIKTGWWDNVPVPEPQPEDTTTSPTRTEVTFVRRPNQSKDGYPLSPYRSLRSR